MKIGGLQHCSLIDYPGKVAAIVFTIGCNFRCPYCHNPELVDETAEQITEERVLEFLTRRRNLLDAVTVTGGEPTLQENLIPFLSRLKHMGFLVKLDTNGTDPSAVRTILETGLVDYVAMDVKAPLFAYGRTVARPVNETKLKETIDLLLGSNIQYEFRTTIVRSLLSPEDIEEIGRTIKGARRYCLQKFSPTKLLNPAFLKKTTYSDAELANMKERLEEQYVDECIIR